MKMKIILLGSVMIALSACASTPKEQPVQQVQQRQTPPPVYTEPVPVEPVQEAPMQVIVPNIIPQGPLPGTAAHFKYLSGDDRVYFGYNEYSLNPQTRDVLRAQAQWLQNYPQSIVVIGGNADERGTREYNLALGARRADSVKAFLVSQGVSPSRITTVSYGKERPIDGGSDEAAWAMNRNAHSAVLVGSSS